MHGLSKNVILYSLVSSIKIPSIVELLEHSSLQEVKLDFKNIHLLKWCSLVKKKEWTLFDGVIIITWEEALENM